MINVRSLELRVSVASEITIPLVIREDENDVRPRPTMGVRFRKHPPEDARFVACFSVGRSVGGSRAPGAGSAQRRAGDRMFEEIAPSWLRFI
jgi:hypothetical protein